MFNIIFSLIQDQWLCWTFSYCSGIILNTYQNFKEYIAQIKSLGIILHIGLKFKDHIKQIESSRTKPKFKDYLLSPFLPDMRDDFLRHAYDISRKLYETLYNLT